MKKPMFTTTNFVKILTIMLLCLPLFAEAQYVNFGINGGIGLGGFQVSGIEAKTGLNPEFGAFLRYNFLPKISFQGTINFEMHKFILSGGKQYGPPPGGGNGEASDAPDFTVKPLRITTHAFFAYALIEDRLDLLAGGFIGMGFKLPEEYQANDTYFGVTDAELADAFNNGTTNELNSSSAINKAFNIGRPAGLSVGISGGTEKLRALLVYDFGLSKKYANEVQTNKITQNLIKLVVVYIIK